MGQHDHMIVQKSNNSGNVIIMKKEFIKISKDDYKKALSEYICLIIFEKTDGTMRSMLGTLHSSILPQKQIVEDAPKKIRKEPENVISVFDIEKSGWRSFSIDKVLQFSKKQKL